MKLRKILLFAAVILCAVTLARTSSARKTASVIRTSPAPDAGKYINVEGSNTLKKWKFNFGILFDYCFEPLEFATSGGARQRGIVDDLFIAHMNGAVAFTDWFTFGANFPLVIAETFYDPFSTAVDVEKQTNKGVFGDMKVEMKFRLLDIDRYHFGISVVPFLYIPTGKSQYFLGTGMWSPGAMLAFDADIKNRLFLSLNAGYRNYSKTNYFNNDPLNPNAVIDDTLILNIGANVRLSDSWSILGEATSESVISALWKNQTQNPAEFLLGMRYISSSPKGLTFTFGGGGGITHGVGSPDYRVLFGVNYRRPVKAAPLEEPEVVVEEKIAITQSIHFEFDRAVIRPVSYPILNDVTTILQQNPEIRFVRVEGHTDWIGSDDYNFRLSEKRANAVRDYLTSNGISYDRLTAVGYGESRPIADNNTAQGRARNRRTEFTVIDSDERAAARAATRPAPTPSPKAPAETQYQARSKYAPAPQTAKTAVATPAPATPPAPKPQPAAPPPAAPPVQRYVEPPASPDGQPPVPDISSLGDVRAYAQIKGIINFAANESELNADAMANLKALADYVRGDRSVIGLRFQAFPGTAAGEMGNSALSWDRAAKTQSYFMGQLQAGGRSLDISSYGFTGTTLGVGRNANNGKVVIWVLRKIGK